MIGTFESFAAKCCSRLGKTEIRTLSYLEYLFLETFNPPVDQTAQTRALHCFRHTSRAEFDLNLSDRQKYEYLRAARSIAYALGADLLDRLDGRILDFSCKSGGSSIFLNAQGGDVTAIDANGHSLKDLAVTNMFSVDKVLPVKRISETNVLYDLVFADLPFRLVKSLNDAELLRDLIYAQIHTGGKVLLTADLLTMDYMRAAFGISYDDTFRQNIPLNVLVT